MIISYFFIFLLHVYMKLYVIIYIYISFNYIILFHKNFICMVLALGWRWIVPLQVISMVNVIQILGSNPGWSMVNGL